MTKLSTICSIFIVGLLAFPEACESFYRPRIGLFEEKTIFERIYDYFFKPAPIKARNQIEKDNLECLAAIRRGDLKGCNGKSILVVLPHKVDHFVPSG